jgi:hypothetical protein
LRLDRNAGLQREAVVVVVAADFRAEIEDSLRKSGIWVADSLSTATLVMRVAFSQPDGIASR